MSTHLQDGNYYEDDEPEDCCWHGVGLSDECWECDEDDWDSEADDL